MKQFITLTFFIILFFDLNAKDSYDECNNQYSKQSIDNLEIFAEVYNSVRYFYPSKGVQSINWDKFAIYGIRKIQDCRSKQELIKNLNELFLPLCREIQIDSLQTDSRYYPLSAKDRKTYIHYGSGKSPYINGFLIRILYGIMNPYHTEIEKLKKNDSLFWYKESVSGIFFAMPTAALEGKSSDYKILEKNIDTISIEQINLKERNYFSNANYRSHRLASVIIAWGNFRHFYTYKDLISVNWNHILREAMQEAILEKDYVDFYFTLCKMLSFLNDGHTDVTMFVKNGIYEYALLGFAPSVLFENINDTLIVKHGTENLPKGSIIDSINDLPIYKFIKNKENYISASPQLKRKKVAKELLFSYRFQDSTFRIAFTSPNNIKCKTTISINNGYKWQDTSDFVLKKKGVYIFSFKNPKANTKELHHTLKIIAEDTLAKGIVIDFRNWRFMDDEFLGYFTDSVLFSAPFKTPIVKYPKQINPDFKITNFSVKPQKYRIRIPVVFIIDGSVLSYGESVMGIVEHYKLGYIVGEPSAGINGNVASLTLPVHRIHAYTGMRVDKHDGTPLFCVGITPTHPINSTVHDYLQGKDLQMEKALELIDLNNYPKKD